MLKSKDTLDKANEVFPNILMQLTNNSNNNNEINNNKRNPLMISVSEDPINNSSNNENKIKNSKIMEKIGN